MMETSSIAAGRTIYVQRKGVTFDSGLAVSSGFGVTMGSLLRAGSTGKD
jgi:hypothetical protein